MRTFAVILKLSGVMLAFYSLLSGILGIWNYRVEISGAALPKLDWPTVVALVIIGAVFFITGLFMEKKYSKVEAERGRTESLLAVNDSPEFIYNIIKKARRNSMFMMVLFILLTALFAAVLVGDPEAGKYIGAVIVIGLLALICLGLFAMALLQYVRNFNIRKSKAYLYLVEQPVRVTGVVATFNKQNTSDLVPTVAVYIFSGQEKVTNFMLKPGQVDALETYLRKHNKTLVFERK